MLIFYIERKEAEVQSVIRIVQHQTTKFLADDDETFKVVHKTYSVISQTKEGIWGFKCF